MTDQPHALYRFYSGTDELLYVGITVDPGARWKAHSRDKAWWVGIARVTVQRYPSREAVLLAERAAIIAEKPIHNVVHNRGRRPLITPPPAARPTHLPYTDAENLWTYHGRKHGTEWTRDLYLHWEADGDPISGDWVPSEIDARDLLDQWASRYGPGDVPIHWGIVPIWETAPFHDNPLFDEDFLTFFTWPVSAHDRERLNFNRLPVVDKLWNDEYSDTGGFIQQATGWKPSPFQRSVNVARLLASSGIPAPRHYRNGGSR